MIDLRTVYPKAKLDILTGCQDDIGVLDEFGITANRRRLTFFLAQVGHESGGLTIREENLRYSAKRMTEVWPGRFPTVQAAAPYANNPQKLAEKTYGGRMGNGPEGSGDGYRYRGQGGIQITGKEAYEAIGEIAGLDLVNHPDMASDPKHYLRVACAFWEWKKLNALCDKGDFRAVTKRINGGYTGLADRQAWLVRVERAVPAGVIKPAPSLNGLLQVGSTGPRVEALQRELKHLRYSIGLVDGHFGNITRDAVLAWQADNDHELTGTVTPDQVDAIAASAPRPLAEGRVEASTSDVAKTSRIATLTDAAVKTATAAGAAVGAATGADKAGLLEQAQGAADKANQVKGIVETAKDVATSFGIDLVSFVSAHGTLVLAVALVAVGFMSWKALRARVEDHRDGRTL